VSRVRVRIPLRVVLSAIVLGLTAASAVSAAHSAGTAWSARPLSGATSASEGATSCAFVVRWRKRTYYPVAVKVSPLVGRRLGAGQMPGCGPSEPPAPVRLAALPGASPRNAVVAVGWNDMVLVRAALVRRGDLPAAVRELLKAPRCASSHRVRLLGPWLGILSADGSTEIDLLPPYVLDMHVREASESRYLRAFLRLRVTERTRGLITREDIEEVLWEGGDLAAKVRCARGRYLAVRLDPRPPS
jgi:hypothetical protein